MQIVMYPILKDIFIISLNFSMYMKLTLSAKFWKDFVLSGGDLTLHFVFKILNISYIRVGIKSTTALTVHHRHDLNLITFVQEKHKIHQNERLQTYNLNLKYS